MTCLLLMLQHPERSTAARCPWIDGVRKRRKMGIPPKRSRAGTGRRREEWAARAQTPRVARCMPTVEVPASARWNRAQGFSEEGDISPPRKSLPHLLRRSIRMSYTNCNTKRDTYRVSALLSRCFGGIESQRTAPRRLPAAPMHGAESAGPLRGYEPSVRCGPSEIILITRITCTPTSSVVIYAMSPFGPKALGILTPSAGSVPT